jgi:prepilin-type N-terminal cleavage/methylation domain-containing protein/prepilin-type processing-associated H-X9-DG protein
MRRQTRLGFTLVELLVVIGIIALLLGILLPSLSKARDSAKKTVCMANLRSLGQCFMVYANDNHGYGVFYGGYSSPPPPGTTYFSQYWFAANINLNTWDISQGYLTKYYKNPVFLTCPSATEGFTNVVLLGTAPITTYAYNSNVAPNTNAASPAYGAGVLKVSQMDAAAETVALLDAVTVLYTGTPQAVYASNLPYGWANTSPAPGTPNLHGRHAGLGNVLWYDGHATSERPYMTDLAMNLSPTSATPAACTTRDRMKVGFLTPLTKSQLPESQLMANGRFGGVNYYYYAHKKRSY